MSKSIDETLVAFGQSGLAQIAGSATATDITLLASDVTPGLYYSILMATDAGFTENCEETERALADGNPIELTVPASSAPLRFFKMSANTVPSAP